MLRLTTLTSVLALMATGLAAEEIKVGVSPGEHAEIMERWPMATFRPTRSSTCPILKRR